MLNNRKELIQREIKQVKPNILPFLKVGTSSIFFFYYLASEISFLFQVLKSLINFVILYKQRKNQSKRMILNILLQVTTNLTDSTARLTALSASTPPETGGTLWQTIEKGGIIMIPLGILFVVSVYIFIERFLIVRHATRKEGNFTTEVKELLKSNKKEEAIKVCQKTDSPLGRMVEKGINRMGKPIKEVEEAVEVEGKFEVFELEKGLPVLSAIAGIAPMLGFLGTILGVIKIFSDIAVTNDVSIGTVSAGLYVKMVSSAAGLLVGIIAYFFYNWLNVRISKVINKMERNAIGFIDFLKDLEDK